MSIHFSKSKYLLLTLWFCVVLIHFSNLGGLSIYALDEAKNATAAVEMLRNGEWLLPTFNERPRYDKPPLHYYFFVFSYFLFGVSEFSARFFPSLMGILTVLMTYAFTKKHFGASAAFWTLPVFLASIHWFIQFHMAVPDPFLIVFLTLAVFQSYNFIASGYTDSKSQYLSYLGMGLAFLSKGPVAVVLLGAIVLITMLWTKKSNIAVWFRPLPILLFLLVALPWYVAVYIKTDGLWLNEFIFKHNVGRFQAPMEGHGGSFLLPVLFVTLGLFPFSTLFITITNQLKIYEGKSRDVFKFLIIAALVPILFFMMSGTKLPNYTVPAYPFLASIFAVMIANLLSKSTKSPIFIVLLILASLFILALPIAVYNGLDDLAYLRDQRHVAFYFIIPIPLLFASWYFWVKRKLQIMLLLVAFSFASISFTFFWFGMPAIDKSNPVVSSYMKLNRNADYYYFKIYNPSFSFYLQKEIVNINKINIGKLKKGDYVISRKSEWQEFQQLGIASTIIFEGNDLFERPITIVAQID